MPILRPYHPRTQFRGQVKPQGPVRINWSHPLAHNLVSYCFDYGGFVVDLVNNSGFAPPTFSLGGTSSWTQPSYQTSSYGTGAYYNTSTAGLTSNITSPALLTIGAPYTIACGFYTYASAGSGSTADSNFVLNDTVGGASATGFLTYAALNLFAFGVSNGDYGGGGNTPTLNTFNVYVGVATGAFAETFYANGKAVGAGSRATAFTSSAAPSFGFQVPTGLGSIGQLIFWGAFWNNRALDVKDTQLLYTDPYCLLVPAEPEMMALSLPSIANPVGTSMVWV